MKSLHGVNCVLATPFGETDEVDAESLRRLIDHVIDGGVHSAIGLGRVGEVEYLSMEERRQVMEVVTHQVGGRVPVGFGIIDASYEDGLAIGRYAREVGADFVMSRSPIEGDIIEYYRMLTEIIPVMAYDQGVQRELSIEEDILPLVRETGNIIGVKISSHIVEKIQEARKLPGIPPLFCGADMLSMLSYRIGADGVTSGFATLFPREEIRMYELACERRWEEMRDHFYGKFLPVLYYLPGGPGMMGWSVFKHVLYWQGIIDTPLVRPPSLAAGEVRLEEVRQVLCRTGLVAEAAIAR